ncbi:hypothetical protein ABZ651_25255, partial [Streptomyces sp. NPDC007070]
ETAYWPIKPSSLVRGTWAGDLAPPPARDHADRLAALDDAAWGRLRLGPGWTRTARRAEEEVRTP